MKAQVLILALAVASAAALAASPACKDSPSVVGECKVIRGRVFVSNGTPSVRIWPVGTKRILGVGPSEDEAMPEALKSKVTFEQEAFATLEVCPLSKPEAGIMQFVCIESASNISVHKR